MIVRLLGVASIADATWLLVDRGSWARFWGKSLVKMRKDTTTARAVAAGELLLGLWLALRPTIRRRGRTASFRLSEEHPITAA